MFPSKDVLILGSHSVTVRRSSVLALPVLVVCCGDPSQDGASGTPDYEAAPAVMALARAPIDIASRPLSLDTLAAITDAVLRGHAAETLFRVSSGIVAPDQQELFVVNGGWQQVLRYDYRSGEMDSFGRRGRGPGEFMRPMAMARLGADSLVVYDRDQAHFSVFTTAGDYGRTFGVPGVGLRGREPQIVGEAGDRRLVLAVSSGLPASLMDPDSEPGSRARDTLSVVVVDDTGQPTDSVARLEHRMWERLPDPTAFSIAAVEDTWSALVASDGTWVLAGNTHSTLVAALSLAGDTAATLDVGPLVATDRRAPGAPLLDQLFLADDGSLWIGAAAGNDGTAGVLHIDPRGVVGSTSFPAGTGLLDVRGNLVLVRQRDALGAESVLLLSASCCQAR